MSSPIRVLILEDRPDDAELMVNELRRAGFAPDWRRVETETAYLASLDPALDLILADYNLPQYDAARALRALRERGLDIPFIIVTGSISEEMAVECMKQGAADYLLKDRPARLGPAVRQAMAQRQLREEKRQSEKHMRLQARMLEAAANAIMITGRDGRIAWVNPAFTRLTGFSLGEVWGQNPRLLKSGKHEQSFYENMWETILSGQVWRGEIINRRKDGSLYTEDLTITPVRNEHGVIEHFIGIRQDITARKRAEEEIRILAKFPGENPHPVLRLGRDGLVLYANGASEVLLRDWGCGVGTLTPPAWRDMAHEALASQSSRMSEVQCDGRTFSFLVVPVPDAGYVNLYGRDITSRKVAEDAVRRHVERLKNLREIDRAILAAQSPEAIARAALERIRGLVPCQLANVTLFDMGSRQITLLTAHAAGDTGVGTGTRLALEEIGMTEALRQGEVQVVEDILSLAEPSAFDRAIQAEGMRCYVRVPLTVRGELIGTLNLGAETPGRFTQEEVDIAGEVADQLAIGIVNAWLNAATERAAREARSLYEIAQSLTTSLDVNEVLHLIAVKTTELLGAPHAQVVLWDEASQTLRFGAAHGTEAEKARHQAYRLGEGVNGIVAQTQAPLIVNDYQAFRHRVEGMTEIVADIGVPLLYRGRLLGVLNSHATRPGSAFTQDNLALLTSFANQAAIAIENARLFEQIKGHAEEMERRVEERTQELAVANQELEAASRNKSKFLASMSHELRTPLNAILGFSQLLLGQTADILSAKQSRYLTHIHNSGQHLLQLISDILDLSKVEAGKFDLRPEPLAVLQTFDDILVIGRGLANKKGQTIETAIAPDLPPLVADPVRFKQILFNLLSNAVKFTPEGGTITVRAYQQAAVRGQRAESRGQRAEGRMQEEGETTRLPSTDCHLPLLVIEVTDTGVGIRPEDMPRLFLEFNQLETTQAERHEGTGLGLALTRRLVEMHGGRIWAESEGEGKGSTFMVVLPFDRPDVGQLAGSD
jgi:PAS domain S-box-containing protein